MRDSQSLLEQVITFTNADIKYQPVVEILGLTDRHLVLDTLQAILERHPSKTLSIMERFHQTAAEPHLFAQELMEVLRHLTIVKVAGPASQLIEDLQDSERELFTQWAATTSEEDLHLLFDLALKGTQDILKAFDARLVLDMALLRMASAPKIESLNKLLSSLRRGEGSGGGERRDTPRTSASSSANSSSTLNSKMEREKQPLASSTIPSKANTQLPANDQWLGFIQFIKRSDGLLAAKLEGLLFMGLKDKKIGIGVHEKMQFLRQQLTAPQSSKKIQSCIDQYWGDGYTLEIQTVKDKASGFSAQSLTDQKEQEVQEQLNQQIQAHPLVKTAQAIFKSQIKSIKELS